MSLNIDDFYRLFLVPGLNHCFNGPGAWAFGQGNFFGYKSDKINDTNHNILLALVDWVEGGNAPSSITGVGDNLDERIHCMYPQKSVWSGKAWTCTSV
jgi:feruloyl esterase